MILKRFQVYPEKKIDRIQYYLFQLWDSIKAKKDPNLYKPQPPDTPQILYKYRYFDNEGHHLNILKKAELWFSSAKTFNDPFDTILLNRFDDFPRGIAYKWFLSIAKRDFQDLDVADQICLTQQRIMDYNDDPSEFEQAKKNFTQVHYENFGLCCFTSVMDNLLMWAHYSFNHEGFCVGLDTNKLKELQLSLIPYGDLLDLVKIKYAYRIPHINFFRSMLSPHYRNDLMKLICTKSKHWRYEKEYRLLFWGKTNINLFVGHDAIKEIIIGCRCNKKNKNNLLSIVNNTGIKASIYQAIRLDNKFGLEFELIN